MKITSRRCPKCGTPLSIEVVEGRSVCAKCGEPTEKSAEQIDLIRRQRLPKPNRGG